MQNEQIWVAEFQPGITVQLCQGSQNLEFLGTKKKFEKQKHMLNSWGCGEWKDGKGFHLS